MIWTNTNNYVSTLEPRKNVHSYSRDWALTTDGTRKMIQGTDAFIQRFQIVIMTEVTTVSRYGCLQLLPTSKDEADFNAKCEELVQKILAMVFPLSSPTDPQGLGFTVESVDSIEWNTETDDFTFIITATGYDGDLSILVPISRLKRFSTGE